MVINIILSMDNNNIYYRALEEETDRKFWSYPYALTLWYKEILFLIQEAAYPKGDEASYGIIEIVDGKYIRKF